MVEKNGLSTSGFTSQGRITALLALVFTPLGTAGESESVAASPGLLYESQTLRVRGHLEAGINLVAETNLFWDLANRATGNRTFNPDQQWLEAYFQPGVSIENELTPDFTFFGMVSGVGSYTMGTDAFDARNTGRITLEEAYLGFRSPLSADWTMEASLGSRSLRLGTGMLIVNGGGDGFERGALKLGPREAWEKSAILKLSRKGLVISGFYLEPNEMASNDTKNQIAGLDIRWDGNQGAFAGLTYLRVVGSEAPYPKAAPNGLGPPEFLPGGRDGLNTVNFYGRSNPLTDLTPNLVAFGDFAYQWNDRIDLSAWGGRFGLEYRFKEHPWRPTLTYSYQIFSGDDPATAGLERFDPLYYDGSPSTWATGSKSAMVFINSNVQSHNLSLRVTPTKQDIVTLRYAHVRAHEKLSPIQFGQAARLDFSDGVSSVVTGVTDTHLSDDLFLEYTRAINPNTYLTGGVSVSFPGSGITDAAGGDAPVWTGAFINVVINY